MVKGDAPPPAVFGNELVACVGGPNHGGWYFLHHGSGSWMERRRLATEAGAGPADRTLGYVKTDEKIKHQRWDGVEATVLRWKGE
jgi:hypothetical protein